MKIDKRILRILLEDAQTPFDDPIPINVGRWKTTRYSKTSKGQ